jgi:hypothetical protein
MVNPKLVLEAIEEYFEKVTTEQYFEDEARIENEPDVYDSIVNIKRVNQKERLNT